MTWYAEEASEENGIDAPPPVVHSTLPVCDWCGDHYAPEPRLESMQLYCSERCGREAKRFRWGLIERPRG